MKEVILTTLDHIPGYEIEQVIDVVEVLEYSHSNFFVELRNLIMLKRDLKAKAAEIGADAIVGFRYSVFSAGAGGGSKYGFGRDWDKFVGGIILYGTGVKLKKIQNT